MKRFALLLFVFGLPFWGSLPTSLALPRTIPYEEYAREASASKLTCAELFTTRDFQPHELTYMGDDNRADTSEPTVFLQRKIKFDDGREVYVLKRNVKSWRSTYEPAPNNPQGSPRWFAVAMGADVAGLFGFQRIDADHMTVPTSETANLAIEKINKELIKKGKEPIFVSFYDSNLDRPEEMNRYLDEFTGHFRLPIAFTGHYLVHDISYHILAILLGRKELEASKAHVEFQRKLLSALENDTTLAKHIRDPLEQILKHQIKESEEHIDYGTGNFAPILMRLKYESDTEELDNKSSLLAENVQYVVNYLTEHRRSPYVFMDYILNRDLSFQIRKYIEKHSPPEIDDSAMWEQHEKYLKNQYQIARDWIDNLVRNWNDPRFVAEYEYDRNEYAKRLLQRIEEIQTATRELRSNPPQAAP